MQGNDGGPGGLSGREPVPVVPATIGPADGDLDPVRSIRTTPDGPPDPTEPGPFSAVLWLLFRPGRFFSWFGSTEHLSAATWLFMYLGAVATTIDKLAIKQTTGSVTNIPDHWGFYWLMVVFTAMLTTLFSLGIWVGLFRLRLHFCGLRDEKAFARSARIWSASRLISAVPVIGSVIVETVVFDRPSVAAFSDSGWYLLLLPLPFWCIWAAYRGVRVTFPELHRWWVRLWFLALPTAGTGLVVGAFMLLFVIQGWHEEPDLTNTHSYQSNTLSFEYPGNWSLMDHRDEHLPGRLVQIETAQWTYVSLSLVPSRSDHDSYYKIRESQLDEAGLTLTHKGTLSSLGPFHGRGHRAEFRDFGELMVLEHLITEVTPHSWLEIESVAPSTNRELVDLGRARMLETLAVTGFDELPPDLTDPQSHSETWCRLRYPAGWFLDSIAGPTVIIEPWQDASLHLMMYDSDNSLADEIGLTLDAFRSDGDVEITGSLDSWAGLQGEGRSVRHTADGMVSEGLVFVHRISEDLIFEVRTMCPIEDAPLVSDGFTFIEASFELTMQEDENPID